MAEVLGVHRDRVRSQIEARITHEFAQYGVVVDAMSAIDFRLRPPFAALASV